MKLRPNLADAMVTLEPASPENVDLLIGWTMDPIAQGPYKRVPLRSADELRSLLLADPDRSYFLLRRSSDAAPLGRFYWRAWRFHGSSDPIVDWEINIFLADPEERGKGYGTAAQRLAACHLAARPETRSVFAFTLVRNAPERRALLKAGFLDRGLMPNERYPVTLPAEPCLLFVWPSPAT
ncbi:MAG: GNAT family N-acetyltransferase [Candidatus Eiseniibacteriota bacterium]